MDHVFRGKEIKRNLVKHPTRLTSDSVMTREFDNPIDSDDGLT